MRDTPVELIVAAFADEHGADQALKQLERSKKEQLSGLRDAAVLLRDTNEKLHIHETADMGGGKGAGIGALVGGAIGLLFPPAVLAGAVVGAVIGGLGARLLDAGLPDDQLKEIGSTLKPGTSAIVAVVEHVWVDEVEHDLAANGAQMMRQAISEDIARQFQAGQSGAYADLKDQQAVADSRLDEEPPGLPPRPSKRSEATVPPQ